MKHSYFMPSINFMGSGCLSEVGNQARALGGSKALIVTDKTLLAIGIIAKVTAFLDQHNVAYIIYDAVQANPTVDNVETGLLQYQHNHCDMLIAVGGGSPMDCAKAIGLLAKNGGSIQDYEGKDKLAHALPPFIAINTTAGTASEITRFTVITDTVRHVKMAIVDWRLTPSVSINDPDLMLNLPPALTAATGMDALTHAVEAYVSIEATPVTDAVAIKAVELITQNLPIAVAHGHDLTARENMIYGEFLAGMSFNNADLGLVHAMAHQLGGFYNLPHGVCNAVLLPHVSRFNLSSKLQRYVDIAKAMGEDVSGMPAKMAAIQACRAMQTLGQRVGIPPDLAGLGVKLADLPVLAEHALADVCILSNPQKATQGDIIQILRNATHGVRI